MKTDLEYILSAVTSWNKGHKWERDMPLTASIVMQWMQSANVLKEADKQRIESEPTPGRVAE